MRIAVVCDVFPELSETFVVNEIRALERLGHEVRVVALEPARTANPDAPRALLLSRLRRPTKLRGLVRFVARHPARALADLAYRRRFAPAEQLRRLAALAPAAVGLRRWGAEHVHCHFASGAAAEGLRLGRLLGVPVSITAHAYDIFQSPRNLDRKLRDAAFVTTGCEYNARHLRTVSGDAEVHVVVMGVDASEFTRSTAHTQEGHVVAIGRLVEKKGFAHLIDAAARVPSLERLTIAGAGPLESELRTRARKLGLGDRVEFPGALEPGEVKRLLESAAVFALPCVVAADGDRDSMPVSVKEAMAMELPVVVTDEVGLPELVDGGVGRLVPPADSAALAVALEELLGLPPMARAALGGAARQRVLERADVDRETARLAELIAGTRSER